MLPSTAIPLQQTQWRRKLGLDYLRIQKLRPHCEQNDYAHVVVQWPNRVLLSATPWTAARQASLSFTISRSLPKFMSIALVMPSSHLILWWPLLLLPSIFPSIRGFSNESALHIRWPEYWSFSINSSDQYSGLISFSINWFDLLVVQETLESLLQHHSSKASTQLLFEYI